MSCAVALAINVRNVSASSRDALAGWLVVVTDAVETVAASSSLASFGFGCCLDFFLVIVTF